MDSSVLFVWSNTTRIHVQNRRSFKIFHIFVFLASLELAGLMRACFVCQMCYTTSPRSEKKRKYQLYPIVVWHCKQINNFTLVFFPLETHGSVKFENVYPGEGNNDGMGEK